MTDCALSDHIFNTETLICEICNKTFKDYLRDIEVYKNQYRGHTTN